MGLLSAKSRHSFASECPLSSRQAFSTIEAVAYELDELLIMN